MLGRSLLMKASGSLLLYPAYVQEFLDRRTAADVAAGNTQGLERAVTDAFNVTLQDMVADGSLGISGNALSQAASLIKAGVPMMGARTLSGALVPFAADMPAPTNFNFVAGDYNRRTGLGDPGNVSKYLNSNRNNNAEPQNNKHIAFYQTSGSTGVYFSARAVGNDGNTYADHGVGGRLALNSQDQLIGVGIASTGFYGASRNNSTQLTARVNGASSVRSAVSSAPNSANIIFGARINTSSGLPESFANYRLTFYSIGQTLDLAILDARITALSSAIQAAIAP